MSHQEYSPVPVPDIDGKKITRQALTPLALAFGAAAIVAFGILTGPSTPSGEVACGSDFEQVVKKSLEKKEHVIVHGYEQQDTATGKVGCYRYTRTLL